MRSLFDWLQIVTAGEAIQHSFIWGGFAPRTNPLTLHLPFLTEKISFCIPSILLAVFKLETDYPPDTGYPVESSRQADNRFIWLHL